MEEEKKVVEEQPVEAAPVEEAPKEENKEVRRPRGDRRDDRRPRGDRRDRRDNRRDEPKEFEERVVFINRVSKTVKGGRRMKFSALVVVGDGKGRYGFGVGKAAEVPDAIKKAIQEAKNNLIDVPVVGTTIPHEFVGEFGSAKVVLKPAAKGTGVIAGGAVRAVLELSGVENILAKSLGSKSPLNAANATLNALKSLRTFKEVAAVRGLDIKTMLNA